MILGIDTSCYTTSMVAITLEGETIVFEENTLLKVKQGEKGLRQSDGFFQHSHQLTQTYERLVNVISPNHFKAISVSTKPRSVEGSYMPVFSAGYQFAKNLSLTLSLPIYTCSHQEGHIMAALKTCALKEIPSKFYALQISGGTTELLKVEYEPVQFKVTLLGESLDLHFGQLVDRIGVALGLPFPCGQALDAIAAMQLHNDFFAASFKNNLFFNLSGLENKYLELIHEKSPEYIARHLFNTLSQVMLKWISNVDDGLPIVIAGGVASNGIIRSQLLAAPFKSKLYFAEAKYSRDNALGVAHIGCDVYRKETRGV